MRDFSNTYRLQADSLLDVVKPFRGALADFYGLAKIRRRNVRPGPMLNALVYWWATQPPDERRRIGIEACARINALLEDDGNGHLPRGATPKPKPNPTVPLPSTPSGPAVVGHDVTPGRARRKRGPA